MLYLRRHHFYTSFSLSIIITHWCPSCTCVQSEHQNSVRETQVMVYMQKHLPRMCNCRCAREQEKELSVDLPWSCVSVPAPHPCLIGHSERKHQSRAPFWRPGPMNHLSEGPACLSVTLEGELLPFFSFFFLGGD